MSSLKNKDINSLGSVYGSMLNNLKHKIVKESKVKEGEIGEAPLQSGGPTEKGGFKSTKLDKKKLTDKEKAENLYNLNKLSQDEDEEVSKEIKKIAQESLNNFMRKKSIFDQLYENVMSPNAMGGEMEETQELDALGIDTEGESGEESDEVTLTLDRETAGKLLDVLTAVLETEGGEEESGEEDDMGMEEGPSEDEEFFYDEDEETLGTPVQGAKSVDMGKNNKVGSLKVQSGGANASVTDKVGNDGDHGHALVNAKKPNMGTANKVGSLKTGTGAFEQ